MAAKNLAASGVLYTDRRQFYLRPNVVRELWPSVTPFTTVVSSMGVTPVDDPDFKMFEHRSSFQKQEFTLDDATPGAWQASGNPGDTPDAALTVDTTSATPVGLSSTPDASWEGLECEIWDSTKTTYKGVVRIQSAPSSTTITIKALGNPRSAAYQVAAMADNDVFVVIGNAHGEGQTAPEAWSDELAVVYNSTQIFRIPIEITGTLLANAKLRGYSSELGRLRMEKSKEFKMQMEQAFLKGVRSGGTGSVDLAGDNVTNNDSHTGHQTDSDGKVVRTTMGVIPAIYRYGEDDVTADDQNIFEIPAGSYSFSDLVEDTEKIFQYVPDSGELDAFCGRGVMSYWSKVDADTGFVAKSGIGVHLHNWETGSLGFSFRRLETPHGVINLIPTPALRGAYNNTMLVVNTPDLTRAQYRPDSFNANIKTDDGYDGVKDEYFGDSGIGMTLIEKHSVWSVV